MLRGTKTVDVAVSAEAAYARAADVEAYPSWQSFVQSVDVRERDGHGRPTVVACALDAKALVLKATLRYAYDEPRRVSWTYEDGDVKDLNGSFDIVATSAGACRITLAVQVDPGFRIGLLLRGPVEDRVRARVVDGTLDELAAGL